MMKVSASHRAMKVRYLRTVLRTI